jgi:hypothetical protein
MVDGSDLVFDLSQDNVKQSRVGTHLEKPVFFPIRFRYGFHILTFPEIEVMGRSLAKFSASNFQGYGMKCMLFDQGDQALKITSFQE